MTLTELKESVEEAIERATALGDDPDTLQVYLQIDRGDDDSLSADAELDLHYDGGAQATGVVLCAYHPKPERIRKP